MSERSPQERPGDNVTETAGRWRSRISQGPLPALGRTSAPARYLSLIGVGFLTIGAITYLALPGWADTSAASAVTRVSSVSTGPSSQPTIPGPMPGAPTQQPTTPAAPTPSATPTPLQPSDPARVKAWKSGAGGNALATVTELSSDMLMAQAMKQYTDMLQECKGLRTAVGKAQKAGLIPDIAMQAKYAVALVSFRLAAISCITGIRQVPDGVEDVVTNVNQTVLASAALQLSGGASNLFVGTGMLRRH